MKTFKFIRLSGLLLLALGLVSCQKSLQEQLIGTYHFKMSGNFGAYCYGVDSEGNVDSSSVKYGYFNTNSLAGQMRVLNESENKLIVNMSVYLGGELLSFEGTLDGDVLKLSPHEVNVTINLEGEGSTSGFISSGTSASLIMNGVGKLFDDTIMFNMGCNGNFSYYSSKFERTLYCEVNPEEVDIVCQAFKTN